MTRTASVAAVMVALFTMAIYLPALHCGFINVDDPFYITNNILIKSLDFTALRRIFTEAHLAAWIPLTYLSFAVDHYFWGDTPAGYHLTNIMLHGMNAGLVVVLADSLLRAMPGSFGEDIPSGRQRLLYPAVLVLAGLFWSIHPLRVESVAWVAERKDVLNGVFTLAAFIFYLNFVRNKETAGQRQLVHYLLSLGFFMGSLLAKQVSVTLPVILLLLDWYPLERFRKERPLKLFVEKIPFFIGSLLITLITIYFASSQNKLVSLQDIPLSVRFFVSGNAIFEYCRLTFFPVGISPFLIIPKPLPAAYLIKTGIVIAVILFLLRNIKRRPAVAAAWLAFVILLSPMLAFVQAGDDIALGARYTYLPAIFPSVAIAAMLLKYTARLRMRASRHIGSLLYGATALCLVGSGAMTVRMIDVWKDTGTFWSRVIEIKPVGRAYRDRGVFYLINRRSAEALQDFDAAIAIAANARLKTIYNLYAFRGVALSDLGRYVEAITQFDRAIELYPHPTYFQLRGGALQSLGRSAEAERDFRRAGANPPGIEWFE